MYPIPARQSRKFKENEEDKTDIGEREHENEITFERRKCPQDEGKGGWESEWLILRYREQILPEKDPMLKSPENVVNEVLAKVFHLGDLSTVHN